MAEYIEREAAIASIKHEDPAFVYAIERVPAADVRPVVRGHIEEDENTYLWCSECGCDITLASYIMPNGNLILRPNYCPNCGAKMRSANCTETTTADEEREVLNVRDWLKNGAKMEEDE